MSKLQHRTIIAAAAFCFAYTEHNLIRFKLHYNWSAQLLTIFWRALTQIQANQSNLLTFKNYPINNLEWTTCDRKSKSMHSYFYESKKLLGSSMRRNALVRKKRENSENIFFKALANRFWSTSKLISCDKGQQNCLWTTFY